MQRPSEQEANIHDYFLIVDNGRWIIAILFVAVVISTAFLTFRASPVYQAMTTLLIETQKPGAVIPLFEGKDLELSEGRP